MPGTEWLGAYLSRFRRMKHRELREFRAWIETTRNLIRLSVLLLVPLLIAVVTAISEMNAQFSYLLFPPLASGSFTLFADPEGKYSSPWKFIGGLTIGALCGWFSLIMPIGTVLDIGVIDIGVSPVRAALSVFLTGVITWLLNAEISSSFSTALLILLIETPSRAGIYVLSIAVSSVLVSIVFVLWRRKVYAERAQYLYQSTKGDDHVLVPMRGPQPAATAMLGARLAAAHDAGKVVLLHLVSDDDITAAEQIDDDDTTAAEQIETETETSTAEMRETTSPTASEGTAIALQDDDIEQQESDGRSQDEDIELNDENMNDSEPQSAEQRVTTAFAEALEARAESIRTEVGVPCEVVVASEGKKPSRTVTETAHETNCDLIATPYETRYGSLSPFIRELFVGNTDVLIHRSVDTQTDWKSALVIVQQAGDLAHGMLDFATRLIGRSGHLSVGYCITNKRQRRHAEERLADLTGTLSRTCETRVSNSPIESFITTCASEYDLIVIGASREQNVASRFLSPPAVKRIDSLACDVVVLDRNL